MISVENLVKTYPTRFGDKLVLDNVNFELAPGEKLGILGRNGAGKSTLVRLISGAEFPTSGRVRSDVSISWPLAFGGAFQETLTGVDNVRFISRIYHQDFESNLRFVEDFSELGSYLREEVRTYSSGMKARLAFAISMIIEFDCFLIDEVGAVGDARFHARCNYELFEKRADRSMIIISHDANYVRNHCNRWAVLDEGRLTQFSDFDEAYDFFFHRIGLAEPATQTGKRKQVAFAQRARTLESVRREAFADDQFRILVQKGDWARDSHEWAKAQEFYERALALHPYESSYWGQLGNAQNGLGQSVDAEVSYRTACALGEPPALLADFVNLVMLQRGEDPTKQELRSLSQGPTADQPPSLPDIRLFARLFWARNEVPGAEALELMRQHATLDHLARAMLDDPRMQWDLDRPIDAAGDAPQDTPHHAGDLLAQIGAIFMPVNTEQTEDDNGQDPLLDIKPTLRALCKAGAFTGWARTRSRLTERLEPAN